MLTKYRKKKNLAFKSTSVFIFVFRFYCYQNRQQHCLFTGTTKEKGLIVNEKKNNIIFKFLNDMLNV